MKLADFIESQKNEIIARWVTHATDRLRLASDQRPALIDHLPQFLDELVQALHVTREHWLEETAREHGRQRVAHGMNIGSLAEEIGILAETIIELAGEADLTLDTEDVCRLIELTSRGSAESVREYARLRDKQLAEETNRHFSFIAHELRTPLQTARLTVSILQQGIGDQDVLLKRLERAHANLSQLVDNSLVEARLQGRPTLQFETLDLAGLADLAVESVRSSAEQKDVRIERDLACADLDGDPKLVLSILTNLLANAVKFTGNGSRVTLRSRAEDPDVVLEIEDACGGFAEGDLARLFQPFSQSGEDRTGFGLGLMIVKQAVEAHGGTIEVINHPGDGCCFSIRLPGRQRKTRGPLQDAAATSLGRAG